LVLEAAMKKAAISAKVESEIWDMSQSMPDRLWILADVFAKYHK